MATLLSILKSCKVDGEKVVRLDDEDVALVQKRLLYVLDDIIAVCEDNGIEYQMSGGSCLGAVRHQGFIPWDDDIDINLPRRYVKTFTTEFVRRFGDKYYVHIPGVTDGFDYMMIRIMTKDVRARALMESNREECGLCVDVFIVENTFDNPVMRRIHGLGTMAYRYALSCIRFRRNRDELLSLVEEPGALRKIFRKRTVLGTVLSLIPVNAWARGAERWVRMCRREDSKYMVITAGQHQFFREMYAREGFGSSVKLPFEGRMVNVAKDYDNYMRVLYGDYMAIPPTEKREKHAMLEFDREGLLRSLEALEAEKAGSPGGE